MPIRFDEDEKGAYRYSTPYEKVLRLETAIASLLGKERALDADPLGDLERIAGMVAASQSLLLAGSAFWNAAWDSLGDVHGESFSIDDKDNSDRAKCIRTFCAASEQWKSALAKAQGQATKEVV